MESIPFWAQLLALLALLLVSAFFSIAETSMMALNRYKLRHLVSKGQRSARRTAALLDQTEKLLGTVLLGNNLVNTALTTIVTALAIRQFGDNETTLLWATTVVALLIIVFCEITPKVIGATYPERIALGASGPLAVIVRAFTPVVWSINLVVSGLLTLVRLKAPHEGTRMSAEELRTLVLEAKSFVPQKHRSMLVNLFDLERITVDDVMVPRNRIESLNLLAPEDQIRQQLATSYHSKLPVHEGDASRVIGILHVRHALSLLSRETFDEQALRELLRPPYFVPSGTPVFTQMQFFQENRQRMALVVDEYGEIRGLVTLEGILEEIVGDFTTTVPGGETGLRWTDEEVEVDGATALRDLNRRLGTDFPLGGPRTLSGLLLDTLEDIPEDGVSVRFGRHVAEVLQVQDRVIRRVKLLRLPEDGGAPARPVR